MAATARIQDLIDLQRQTLTHLFGGEERNEPVEDVLDRLDPGRRDRQQNVGQPSVEGFPAEPVQQPQATEARRDRFAAARERARKREEEKKVDRNRQDWQNLDKEKAASDIALRKWASSQPKALPPAASQTPLLEDPNAIYQRMNDAYEVLDPQTKMQLEKLGASPNQLREKSKNAGTDFIQERNIRQEEKAYDLGTKTPRQAKKESEARKKAAAAREKAEEARREAEEARQKADAENDAEKKKKAQAAATKAENAANRAAKAAEDAAKAAERSGYKAARQQQAGEQNTRFYADPNGNVIDPDTLDWEHGREHLVPGVWEADEEGNVVYNREEPKRRLALPGRISRLFKVPTHLLKNKKMTDDEKIEAAMQEQMSNYIFQSAARQEGYQSTYAQDFLEGKREPGQYKSNKTERKIENERQVQQQLDWIEFSYTPVESQHIDEYGNIVFDPDTQQAIDSYMVNMGFDPSELFIVFHQVAKRLGYTPDSNGKFLLGDSNKIPDWLFRKALRDMERSVELYGHPYHMFDESLNYGNTKCFPIGIVTMLEAEALCRPGARLQNKDMWDVITAARNDFVGRTLPEMRKHAHRSEAGRKQLYVLMNYVRALCSLDAISPRSYNIAEALDRGYGDYLDEVDPVLNPDKDEAVNEERKKRLFAAERRRDRAKHRLDRKRNRMRKYYAEDVRDPSTGEIVHRKGERVNSKDYINGSLTDEMRSSKVHPFEATCMFTAGMAKFMGVIGFSPVLVGGYIERITGNYYSIVSNRVLSSVLDMHGNNDAVFQPTDAMYSYVTADEFVDGLTAWKKLLRVGGQDAVQLYYTRYRQMNKENVDKFLFEEVNQEGLFTGPAAEKAKAVARKANDFLSMALPGDFGFGKQDAKRWLESLMINNMINANSGETLERSFTSSEIMEMMDTMGLEGFLAAMTDTVAGRDAVVMMRNQTLARESPITHAAEVIMRRSGLTNVLVTFGVDTYFTYGLNLVQNMLPFSNTASFLAVRGLNYVMTGGVRNLDKTDINILNYQMGGLDEFGRGLAKNLVYDFVKIANIGVFACFAAAIFMMIGFDEPEDESQKYVWEEYKIGKKIGLGGVDENGEPQGIPLFRAWWLDDITMFGLPLAYAICAKGLDQKLGDNDPELATKLFFGGCYDVLSGASLLDLTRSIKNAHETLVVFDELMADPNAVVPSSYMSYAYMTFFEIPLARAANKMLVPNAIRDWFKDEYDHTPYYVYDRTSSTPGKTEKVEDWVELQKRIESRYNPVYAIFNNRMENGYWFDDGTTQKTGYLLTEMPIATMKDQRRMMFAETKLDWNPTEIEYTQEDIDGKCEELISIMESYGDLTSDDAKSKAKSDGFWIPFDLRIELIKYCKSRQNYEMNNYNLLVANGIRGTEKNQAYTDYQNNYTRYGNILSEWAFNVDDFPWSDAGYAKLRTDTETVYYYKSTGKPCDPATYLLEGPGEIEKRYIPKGNTPNNLALFTTPETQDRGYNYETISSWADEGTDFQKIFEEQEGRVVSRGKDEGVPINTAVFGGFPGFKTDTEEPIRSEVYNALNMATMGYRGYVPFDEKMLLDLPNYRPEQQKEMVLAMMKSITNEAVDGGSLGDMGKYYDKSHWISSSTPNSYGESYGYFGSSGYRSYGGGGGGYGGSSSSYNPKIYSSPRQVNSDRAATMYTKSPHTASTSYLRPSVSTKGSREAYRRQDF